MKEESQNPRIDPELEARIVALVLGEASDFERDQLNRLIEERPELAALKEQIHTVHGLLQDVGAGELVANDDDWKLSTEKRRAVLARISGEVERPLARQTVNTPARKRQSLKEYMLSNFTKIAAVVCVAGFLGIKAMQALLPTIRASSGPAGFVPQLAHREELLARAEPMSGARESRNLSTHLWNTDTDTDNDAAPNDLYVIDDHKPAAADETRFRTAAPAAVAQTDEGTNLSSALGAIRRSLEFEGVAASSGAVNGPAPATQPTADTPFAADVETDWSFEAKGDSTRPTESPPAAGKPLSDDLSLPEIAVIQREPNASDLAAGGSTAGVTDSGSVVVDGNNHFAKERSELRRSGELQLSSPATNEYFEFSRAQTQDSASGRQADFGLDGRLKQDIASPSFAATATEEINRSEAGNLQSRSDLLNESLQESPSPGGMYGGAMGGMWGGGGVGGYGGRNAYDGELPTSDVSGAWVDSLAAGEGEDKKGEGFQADGVRFGDRGATASADKGSREWYAVARSERKPQSVTTALEKRSAGLAGLNEQTAEQEAYSTFSLHVSDVSFKLAQAALAQGEWPEAAKVRIEEFVNAFDYGDPLPSPSEKVACRVEQCIHPFLQQRNLLRLSLRTAAAGRASNTPLRLTFLLDNSGSMERIDRQQTVRRAFALLAQQLTAIDQVTLIGFARQPRLLADKVSGSQAQQLVQLVDDLPSEGGTNIEAALQLAFEKAQEQQVGNAQNRIILLTDGAVNLGDANPASLSRMITTMRDAGIAFDAAGISAEGLNDEILEALTRQGDGRYYLLDSPEAADDGFARQIAGALRPSAQNVKVQVEFNPKRVGRYKLLGFEKHLLNQEDFRNDKVDAAEMAAAEAGVAVYQLEAKPDGDGDVGSVSVRFRDLATGQMIEKRWPIPYEADAPRPDQAAPSLRIATSAALLAAKLRAESLGEIVDLKTLSDLISGLPDRDRDSKRVQQLQLMIQQALQVSRP